MKTCQMKILIIRDSGFMWVALELDRDIAAQGTTFYEMRDALMRTIAAQDALDVNGDTYGPAPERYVKCWENGIKLDPGWVWFHIPNADVRIADRDPRTYK